MKRDLIYLGHPNLRKTCEEVTEITDEIRELAQDLIDTVIANNGAGLAAPQINRLLRMFVILYENGADSEGMPILTQEPQVFINPKLFSPSEEAVPIGEGCLSIPGAYEEVTRPQTITVEAMDLNGKIFTEEATGWRARVIMHENDHLNGVLFIDRIDPKIKKKIDPLLREIKKKYH